PVKTIESKGHLIIEFGVLFLAPVSPQSPPQPASVAPALSKHQDDRPHWKASASGDDSHFDYVHDQNQKNLGGMQSMMYRDKLMTAL
ncbi:hypothetical protein E2I00_001005, partial [Balaenoptera physalus]